MYIQPVIYTAYCMQPDILQPMYVCSLIYQQPVSTPTVCFGISSQSFRRIPIHFKIKPCIFVWNSTTYWVIVLNLWRLKVLHFHTYLVIFPLSSGQRKKRLKKWFLIRLGVGLGVEVSNISSGLYFTKRKKIIAFGWWVLFLSSNICS